MGFAKLTSAPRKIGRGRFTVSEGIAPAEKILADEDLATLYQGLPGDGDEFFQAVLLQGTVVSVYQKVDGRYVATYCRGLSGYDVQAVQYNPTSGVTSYQAAGANGAAVASTGSNIALGAVFAPDDVTAIVNAGGVNGVAGSLGQAAKPIGVLFKDAFRPFDQGDNEGISFFTHGYVEWPLCKILASTGGAVLFDNTALKVGSYVKPDALGRPVKWMPGEPEELRIAQVIAREDLLANGGAANVPVDYDYGMLEWMTLPQDTFNNPLVTKPFEVAVFGQATPYFGVRPNLDAADDAKMQNAYGATSDMSAFGVVGAVRANLINL